MINYAFYKKSSPTIKEVNKKYFEELGPCPKMEISKYEAPIQSIRRIVGDNFWDLEKSKEDLINLEISDKATFNIEAIKADNALNNYDIMNTVAEFIVTIYNKFAQMYGNTIIGKDFEEVKFKVGVTSSKGLICKELSIADFAPLSSFDENGNVIGVASMTEIVNLQQELTGAVEASNKLKSSGGAATNAAIVALTTKITELNGKLVTKYMSLIETFYNLCKMWGDVDKASDIWNVSFVMNLIIVGDSDDNPQSQDSIVEMDILSMHDIAHHHLKAVHEKFD